MTHRKLVAGSWAISLLLLVGSIISLSSGYAYAQMAQCIVGCPGGGRAICVALEPNSCIGIPAEHRCAVLDSNGEEISEEVCCLGV